MTVVARSRHSSVARSGWQIQFAVPAYCWLTWSAYRTGPVVDVDRSVVVVGRSVVAVVAGRVVVVDGPAVVVGASDGRHRG